MCKDRTTNNIRTCVFNFPSCCWPSFLVSHFFSTNFRLNLYTIDSNNVRPNSNVFLISQYKVQYPKTCNTLDQRWNFTTALFKGRNNAFVTWQDNLFSRGNLFALKHGWRCDSANSNISLNGLLWNDLFLAAKKKFKFQREILNYRFRHL